MHAMPRTLLIAAMLVAALGACRKEAASDRATEAMIRATTGQDVDVDSAQGTTTIRTPDGEVKIASDPEGGVALPAGFPTDLFLPEGARPTSVIEIGGAHVVTMTAPISVAAASSALATRMAAEGWKQEMSMSAEGSTMQAYAKDGRNAVYQLSDEDGKLALSLQVSSQQ